MKLYNEANSTWKYLTAQGIAGYCGGNDWHISNATYRDWMLGYGERGRPPEEVARERMAASFKGILRGCMLRKFRDVADLHLLLGEIASEEQRQQFYEKHNNECNVRIGDTVYLAGAARSSVRGTAWAPPARHRSRYKSIAQGWFSRDWWPTHVGRECSNLSQMFNDPGRFDVCRLRTMIGKDQITQCIAQHCTRGVRGRFNMEVYDLLPTECRDDDGLVRQWHEIGKKLYACMPLPLFGNPLHGGGFSWASFFYRTDNPDNLPSIKTGTAREVLA